MNAANPEFPAPFISSVMHIEPQWIDYNGHLNVAYYNVLFDRAVDELYEPLGLGPDYLKHTSSRPWWPNRMCVIYAS